MSKVILSSPKEGKGVSKGKTIKRVERHCLTRYFGLENICGLVLSGLSGISIINRRW